MCCMGFNGAATVRSRIGRYAEAAVNAHRHGGFNGAATVRSRIDLNAQVSSADVLVYACFNGAATVRSRIAGVQLHLKARSP